MSFNFLIRGLFLSFCFPKIITAGRRWYKTGPSSAASKKPTATDPTMTPIPDSMPVFEREEDFFEPNPTKIELGSSKAFDLFFLKASMLLEGILTASAGFSTKPWHLYLCEST